MAVVLGVGLGISAVATPEDRLELDTRRLLGAKRLQLREGVLPVELATLLLPLVVGLHLFLPLVGVPELADLLEGLLAFILRLLRYLNQLLHLAADCLVLALDHALQLVHFVLHLALNLVHLVLYGELPVGLGLVTRLRGRLLVYQGHR